MTTGNIRIAQNDVPEKALLRGPQKPRITRTREKARSVEIVMKNLHIGNQVMPRDYPVNNGNSGIPISLQCYLN